MTYKSGKEYAKTDKTSESESHKGMLRLGGIFSSWKGFMIVAAAVGLAYQSHQMASLNSQLAIQETRITKLEQQIIANSALLNGTLSSVKTSTDAKETVPTSNNEAEAAVIEHAPHSHYAIETINGVPIDHDKKYHLADFQEVFHVTPIWEDEETPEATRLLNENIVWYEAYYRDSFDDIAPLASKAAEFFENLKHEDHKKFYVKWESKQTGFGLYATTAFKLGDIVDLYPGVLYADWAHLDQKIDTDYTWSYPSDTGNYPHGVNFGVDARVKGNYLRFANHAGDNANTRTFFIPYNNRWKVFYVAIKDIAVGDAITSDYGSEYFKDRPLI